MLYKRLFNLCGWSDEEIMANRERIEFTLEKIDCTDEASLKHAEEHVAYNFDLTIPGAAKMLGVYLHEFVDAVNIRNDYDYYVATNYPLPPAMVLSFDFARKRTGKKVAVRSTTQLSILILGVVFDKYTRVLESGELIGQAAGKAHCAQYQAEAGLLELGILPVPDLVMVSGWFCDQACEADELLSDRFGYEALNIDGCMDHGWIEKPAKRNIQYTAMTMQKAFERVEAVTGLQVTEEDNHNAWGYFNNVAIGSFSLINMVAISDPQPISHADVTVPYLAAMVAPGVERLDTVLDAMNEIIAEVNRRIEEGIGILPKGAPKVYVGLRSGCDMRSIKVVEECGMAITNMFVDGMGSLELEAPIIENPNKYEQAAEYFIKRPQFGCPLYGLNYWVDQVTDYNCDGAVLTYCFNCRPFAIPALMGRDYIEKKTGRPVMVLEGDYYDSRLYSPGQQKSRLEAFAEMLKLNKEIES
jgi:benzoyl-CoA reductase/2-hydroxyglutaryl-CoA dehydratase subunit BcrC/BadD/HgdB